MDAKMRHRPERPKSGPFHIKVVMQSTVNIKKNIDYSRFNASQKIGENNSGSKINISLIPKFT